MKANPNSYVVDDGPVSVKVVSIDISFVGLVILLVKIALASIPALIILFIGGAFWMAVFGGVIAALLR